MFEWLKAILGEAYSEDIDRKVAAEIGKGFVSREDFNGVNHGKKKLEEELRTAREELRVMKQQDPQKLKEEIRQLKQALQRETEAYEARILTLRKEAALKAALAGKVYDPDDFLRFIDLNEVELEENGRFPAEWEGVLTSLQEKKPYLFLENPSKPVTLSGAVPALPREKAAAQPEELNQWRTGAGLPLR